LIYCTDLENYLNRDGKFIRELYDLKWVKVIDEETGASHWEKEKPD